MSKYNIINRGVQYLQLTEVTKLYGNEIFHGFYTRDGGVSTGYFKSLNCGLSSGDNRTNITSNLNLITNALIEELESNGLLLRLLNQDHTNHVYYLRDKNTLTEEIIADAIITNQRGVAIAVQTADCLPILCYDRKNKTIAAIHSGWRGAQSGVINNTISQMADLKGSNPSDIVVMMGPAIRQRSYEVNQVFYSNFITCNEGNHMFFQKVDSDKYHFDLIGYCYSHLLSLGVTRDNIYNIDIDTYSNNDQFFSCRRSKHQGHDDFGRQLSLITLL